LIRNSLKKFWQHISKALQQGISPQKLAITCSLGAILSLFPVYGLTTLLCMAMAPIFRLNILVMLAVNYLLTPIQLLLMIPFLQGGILLFGLNNVLLDLDELILRFKSDFISLINDFGSIILGGIVVWAMIAIPIFFMLYYAFYWIILRWKSRRVAQVNEPD
jgi:uncharacterized protein (DUF2062 family)